MKRDPVSPELRDAVFARDRAAIELALFGGFPRWYATLYWSADRMLLNYRVVCAAVLIDRQQIGKCRGRWTLDHIKDEARLGVRAASDPAHLVSLCEGHTENGIKAGHQWNTANRPALREYLASVA